MVTVVEMKKGDHIVRVVDHGSYTVIEEYGDNIWCPSIGWAIRYMNKEGYRSHRKYKEASDDQTVEKSR